LRFRLVPLALLTLTAVASTPAFVAAQGLADGHVSLLADYLPNSGDALELRGRVFVARKLTAGEHFTFNLAGFMEGLIADRDGARGEGVVRPQDLFVQARYERFDVIAGFARVVWGRLDELQPGDVVNPLDVSRFFFEGRSEARLPVAVVRTRVFLPHDTVVEGVVVPVFRRGRFDQLGDSTSPFNLARDTIEQLRRSTGVVPPFRRAEVPIALGNMQGGVRVTTTTGRVDWGVSAYRGIEPFPFYEMPDLRLVVSSGLVRPPFGPAALAVTERFPRFVMVAGDFETARGEWGIRGELAAYPQDSFQEVSALGVRPVEGGSMECGIGVDRRAGSYRVSGTVLIQRQWGAESIERTDLNLIASADRSFARETRTVRAFVVYSAKDRTAFVRGIAAVSFHDNVWLEWSVGWFAGDGLGSIARFSDRDFAYTRLKVFF
jgi:hypothetical protein